MLLKQLRTRAVQQILQILLRATAVWLACYRIFANFSLVVKMVS